MSSKKSFFTASLALAVSLPGISLANSQLESRIQRLENVVNNQFNVENLNNVQSLQQEVQELRGLLEEQEFQMKLLYKRQADLQKKLKNANVKSEDKVAVSPRSIKSVSDKDNSLKTAINSNNEDIKFNQAYELLVQKKYDDAISLFKEFIWEFPKSEHVADAYYLTGEMYFNKLKQNNNNTLALDEAKVAFNKVLSEHQEHNRYKDSMLKLGLLELSQGNKDSAKQHLEKLKNTFPNSSAARIAEIEIKKM